MNDKLEDLLADNKNLRRLFIEGKRHARLAYNAQTVSGSMLMRIHKQMIRYANKAFQDGTSVEQVEFVARHAAHEGMIQALKRQNVEAVPIWVFVQLNDDHILTWEHGNGTYPDDAAKITDEHSFLTLATRTDKFVASIFSAKMSNQAAEAAIIQLYERGHLIKGNEPFE